MSYVFPKMDVLKNYDSETKFSDYDKVNAMADQLSSIFQIFGVDCKITDATATPFAALYDILPDQGVSVKKFRALRIDLELWMASPVEIVGIGEEKVRIGLAIKNLERPIVGLKSIMDTKEFNENKYKLPIAGGLDILGSPFVFDLADTPHLLVAGATGSGKSTFMNDIILSILYTRTPEEVQMIMIDPKMVELTAYNGIPHLIRPVITDTQKSLEALKWIENEMMRRYDLFSEHQVRTFDAYNQKVITEKKLPRIVLIVDEYMEMMIADPITTEKIVKHLASASRAVGIHLILATQRPSKKVITNSIKTNIPTRASFTVVDGRESRVIIDRTGAERLLGNGDMIYSKGDATDPIHAQAAFVDLDEIDRVIADIKMFNG